MRNLNRQRDRRPMARRDTDFGFSYMAPEGAPPAPRFTLRGCLGAATATFMLLLGVALVVAGTQYPALVSSIGSTGPPQSPQLLEQTGRAVLEAGLLATVGSVLWLLGIGALRRRRLGLRIVPQRPWRRRKPRVIEPVDDDSDLF